MTTAFNLLTVPTARTVISTGLSDGQLSEAIAREEAFLARQLSWPAGLGEAATQTFYVNDPALRGMYIDTAFFSPANAGRSLSFGWVTANIQTPLWLLRPADPDSVVVTDGSIELDPAKIRLLRRRTLVERADAAWHGPAVSITYAPGDLDEVTHVVIELLRLTLTETGFDEESIGDYRYVKSGRGPAATSTADRRSKLVRSLRTHWPVTSVRIPSSSEDRRIGGFVAS